jgi:uncharacterized protein involved in exopolysaccharide biosynthesis
VTPAHPSVKQAEGQIEKLREKLTENLNNIRLSLNSSINTLKGKSSSEQSRLKGLPYELKEYVEMERQINTKLALYSL